MQKFLTLTLFFLFSIGAINAQKTFPINEIADHRDGHYAFTNATIFKNYNEKIENATLVIKKGKVVVCGTGARVPSDAIVIDASGKTIYPAFVDIFSGYGMPEVKRGERSRTPQVTSKTKGAYSWNQSLRTEFNASENFTVNSKAAEELRKIGFGTVLAHRTDGISRGTAALVALGESREHEMLLNEKSGHVMAFRRGASTQNYPRSLMGIIALLRQTYLDAEWYQKGGHKEETNLSLEAWNNAQSLPQIFEVGNKLEALRAAKIANEFGKKYIIKGSGDEYQRADALRKTGSAFIIPVNYPKAYDVENPYDAQAVELSDMKHWELAPSNASFLAKAGIEFAFTTADLKSKGDFLKNIKKAIKRGLSEEAALKALTYTPAKLVNANDQIGSLKEGALASFLITNGNVFGEKESKIHQTWVKGEPFILNEIEGEKPSGVFDLKVGSKSYSLHLNEGKAHLQVNDSTKTDVKFSMKKEVVDLSFSDTDNADKKIRLTGTFNESKMSGRGKLSDGSWTNWSAGITDKSLGKGEEKSGKKSKKGKDKPAPGNPQLAKVTYPFMAFGWSEKPTSKTTLFRNATVWTNEKDGVMKNTSVLLRNGKIAEIGKELKPSGDVEVIDASGMHLTCGVVDEHTHIAGSRGINEGSQASSAEVRIGDIVNSEDINIYRQLAGGVTTAQILHGSANPIGGQSAIIKFRWGFEPEEMKVKGADGFIKFALGENVKQSNWGIVTNRFPQTRMGVEQVYVDHFTRALDYKKAKSSGKLVRKDLEMECLQEILESRRFISCHSYVQSEINMLMKVAESFDFRINTFTHILEGYKVADKMAKHGAGGSTFSDWWAYKYEVIDAIPHNAAIMNEQGVTVAINSDDAEMARRLNQEAAKAVKYGNMSEEDAWKTVTLNPAKLLHLDDRIGSIKVGKDADVVLWSDHPLSIYAKAEQTYVDGIKFFDRTQDEVLQKELSTERNRLIQKMLADKKGGGKMQKAFAKPHHHYHCDDEEDEGNF